MDFTQKYIFIKCAKGIDTNVTHRYIIPVMEKLRNYLNSYSTNEQVAFALICNTTIGYLRKAISVGELLKPATCVLIEQHTKVQVTRKDLRPNDWESIWPELKTINFNRSSDNRHLPDRRQTRRNKAIN